ncbi:hypothetical protein COC60_17805 [Bacillus thuringiensis]|uniref:Uncharacterized protein n=5 Tax=Bacillaceae TaxID=186817 RepID=A0AB35PGH1_BACTU|nr:MULTISPECIES: hypothetical protein [Bacillus]AJH06851.1 hypothetical protein AS86_2770 [Bacillus thuringiensis HD1002]EAO51899.1 hypothetical protein RBTH_02203 [Bacillus thuringiensis serovar israelensis ATCC 35646]KAA0786353.1 hypothetical protein DN406_25610 [Bacillus sp. BB56-3]KRD76345.1 hypothetical protein ASE53_21220 [Bacillus sp. Root11]KRD93657.1 hypothetical protein ASE54_28555 [Bacillus sp. Root131]OTX76077.1 hypothetical protein BK719_07745 [Bacillus thuringiensis serovar novo
MEEGGMVEIKKEIELVFLGDEKKITIVSFGSMYPNDDELYLRDLQLNFLAVSSNNIHYECKGPMFLRSEIIKFGEELEALLRKDIKEAVLSADEEEIEFKVKLKKNRFLVYFTFVKNDLINEKWEYETSFGMEVKVVEEMCCKIKKIYS